MKYGDRKHVKPAAGSSVPGLIISEYTDGDVLVFSHGSFDIWCVYHAVPFNASSKNFEAGSKETPYPFKLDEIEVSKATRSTEFQGSFSDYAFVEFEFEAPRDIDYLNDIHILSDKYGKQRVWEDFLTLYESIPQTRVVEIDEQMTATSMNISETYPSEENVRFLFDCLLCAMVAENNRTIPYKAILGKKVKALGVYQAIFETDMTISEVANYSRGKGWRVLDAECWKRGITTFNLR